MKWRGVALAAALLSASLLGGLLIFTAASQAGSVVGVLTWLGSVRSAENSEVSVLIEPGETATTIARKLEDAGLIKQSFIFTLLVSYRGVGDELKAGKYRLSRGMDLQEIVEELRRGQGRDLLTVTILEGWRAEEIADALESMRIGSKQEFLSLVEEGEFSLDLLAGRPAGASLEGYLFPDTYLVPPDIGSRDFIQLMLTNFAQRLSSVTGDSPTDPALSLHELVTLASIVEREARLPEERATIAGVLFNRLAEGIPLAVDPTVQYALALDPDSAKLNGYWKQELTVFDLEMDSPYNTYKVRGIPPGPICNPGLDSIKAVIHPQEHDYLYFVARPDGGHAFSSNFEAHQSNVIRYRRAVATAND